MTQSVCKPLGQAEKAEKTNRRAWMEHNTVAVLTARLPSAEKNTKRSGVRVLRKRQGIEIRRCVGDQDKDENRLKQR